MALAIEYIMVLKEVKLFFCCVQEIKAVKKRILKNPIPIGRNT